MRLWWNYSISKAALFMRSKWELRGPVLILGPLFFCIGWRESAPGGVWLDEGKPIEPCDPGFFGYVSGTEVMGMGAQESK